MALVASKALGLDISMRRKTKWYRCAINDIGNSRILRLGVYTYCECNNLVQLNEVDVIFNVLPVCCIWRRLGEVIL